MDIISMIISCILWFITGVVTCLITLIGCLSGYYLNDKESLDSVKDDEIAMQILNFTSAFPGYSLGKWLAVWIKEQENDL